MRDGAGLATDLTLPADGGPRAALLVRTPYSLPNGEDILKAFVHDGGSAALVEDGWAVVVQSCRGRYESEGVFEPFLCELDDGYDCVEWVAAQPWCDGRVVMTAPSYPGLTQTMAALARPPSLAAINPQVTMLDPRRYWVQEGGAMVLDFNFEWAGGWLIVNQERRTQAEREAVNRMVTDDKDAEIAVPLATMPLRQLCSTFDAWVRDDPDHWAPLEAALDAGPADVPAFHFAGWYDLFCEGSLAAYERMKQGAAPQRLVVGPWIHRATFGQQFGGMDFGPAANGGLMGFKAQMTSWLRDAADGKPVATGAAVFVLGDNEWVELPDWPPPAVPVALYLGPGGTLVSAAPAASGGVDRFVYNPDDPVPTTGGRTVQPWAGPLDQREVEQRDDVLVYTGDVLAEDFRIAGLVTAEIDFATTAASADVTVKLVDVYPDGRAILILDSAQRSPFTPGEATAVTVTLGHIAATFKAGHRVRVEVSSSNFPRLDRNPSDGTPAHAAAALFPAEQSVYLGRSCIRLPVFDRGILG
jgi:putative CocE/NonD family hydrolase